MKQRRGGLQVGAVAAPNCLRAASREGDGARDWLTTGLGPGVSQKRVDDDGEELVIPARLCCDKAVGKGEGGEKRAMVNMRLGALEATSERGLRWLGACVCTCEHAADIVENATKASQP
eukprot:CAMPEP_0206472846 /NCGR_PEP_ID=MMETSP0324_2-20121206/32478_1 /ASSEMBLY_ACC=CAM_ASM_000836 /TAXON_ID=2866 /ORGANISM="Crypthecodinium cohnii, Strain Seligo" /LENGTH=118 /DNA_ID=CAMNT_0053947593 /DNA_START=128 /DNA_END=484 /DNA_ORIENTATION=-